MYDKTNLEADKFFAKTFFNTYLNQSKPLITSNNPYCLNENSGYKFLLVRKVELFIANIGLYYEISVASGCMNVYLFLAKRQYSESCMFEINFLPTHSLGLPYSPSLWPRLIFSKTY